MAEPPVPYLRVVRGDATAQEIAALVAVLAAAGAARAAEPAAPARAAWSDPARRLRVAPRPGAGAWRRSALP